MSKTRPQFVSDDKYQKLRRSRFELEEGLSIEEDRLLHHIYKHRH